MKRMKVMFGQRRIMILATLAILVLAAAALAASSANFTATSANPGNMFTAGNLAIDNSKGNGASESAILTAANMKPGDPATTGTVTVKNIGSVAGVFSLTKTMVADADSLGSVLQLTIKEGATTLYSGSLAGYLVTTPANSNTIGIGTWNANIGHTYDFSVSWPATHTGAPTDTALMGKTCTYRFQWDAVSN
jgi:hypothetical protein